ncbi:hypothetical protein SISNIDRAFT_455208 [Sistotremastrum niveocremeum HHB9708]|uniref:Response regulatory domain-containing protein n=1 Tax=Sistotremastrum niveocremeum HHB9708 TaxID=1314777 RepID=A0A164TTF1_9AGAM|nr:hypothetical protein SISNIDRAFT_455208 [Sistotremastrum niveocremeum HHB9708]
MAELPKQERRGSITKDDFLAGLPSSSKFRIAYSDTPPNAMHQSTTLFDSQEESGALAEGTSMLESNEDIAPTPVLPKSRSSKLLPPSTPPRLARAFSMPLPAQLGHLQNPRRPSVSSGGQSGAETPVSPFLPPSDDPQLQMSEFHELSLELADSVQMAIQTMLQVSPPHILDPAKEQFAGCAIPIPMASISALLHSMKNLNYMSAHMSSFVRSQGPDQAHQIIKNDFDIGEMLQSVGDGLSGIAAQAEVDLVLYHGDVGMKHVSVRGDECGISYALSHVLRQIIATSRPGDTVEVGLFIVLQSNELEIESQLTSDDADTPLVCTFQISHVYPSRTRSGAPEGRPHADLNNLILTRLLSHVQGSLIPVVEEVDESNTSNSRQCSMIVKLDSGEATVDAPPLTAEEEAVRQPFPDLRLAQEPTLAELAYFSESLKGKRAILHASGQGAFARRLSSYLTAWGMDVNNPVEDARNDGATGDGKDSLGAPSLTDSGYGSFLGSQATQSPTRTTSSNPGSRFGYTVPIAIDDDPESKSLEGSPTQAEDPPASFFIIDDDVDVLRRRLVQLRVYQPYHLNLQPKKRPSLASNHRPRSTQQIKHVSSSPFNHSSVTIHFTSLQKYKLVRDLIQSLSNTPTFHSPEVIVIPKPAGPRRFLTALLTAVQKPVVDPFFSPIATSPMSPVNFTGTVLSPFVSSSKSSRTGTTPPGASRNHDRPNRSPRETPSEPAHILPPSPLAHEIDASEYFADNAMKLGSTAASGLLIQSPDGQPAGIFFQPKPRQPRRNLNPGSRPMERETPAIVPSVLEQSAPSPSSRTIHESAKENARLKMGSRSRTTVGIPEEPALPAPPVSEISATPPHLKVKTRSISNPLPDVSRQSPVPAPVISPTPGTPELPALIQPTPAQATPSSPKAESSRTPPATTARPRRPTADSASSARKGTPPLSPRADSGGSPSFFTSSQASTPRKPRRAGTDVIKPVAGAPGKKGKGEPTISLPINVLIVEDNPINQTILTTFMKRKKISYDTAANGQEAVDKWKVGNFHLILMDIQMPVKDGIEATKEIRSMESARGVMPGTPANEARISPSASESASASTPTSSSRGTPTAGTPYRSSVIIVALTASNLQSDRVAALAAGCNDFLTKPVSLMWLNSKIIEWGSIKALQMWAERRPELTASISTEQNIQASALASKLRVPASRLVGATAGRPEAESSSGQGSKLRGTAQASESTAPSIVAPSSSSDESSLSDSKSTSTPKPLPKSTLGLVSGKEALEIHLSESRNEDLAAQQRESCSRPTVLGQRALSAGPVTIDQVLHSSTNPSPISDSSTPKPDVSSPLSPPLPTITTTAPTPKLEGSPQPQPNALTSPENDNRPKKLDANNGSYH